MNKCAAYQSTSLCHQQCKMVFCWGCSMMSVKNESKSRPSVSDCNKRTSLWKLLSCDSKWWCLRWKPNSMIDPMSHKPAVWSHQKGLDHLLRRLLSNELVLDHLISKWQLHKWVHRSCISQTLKWSIHLMRGQTHRWAFRSQVLISLLRRRKVEMSVILRRTFIHTVRLISVRRYRYEISIERDCRCQIHRPNKDLIYHS